MENKYSLSGFNFENEEQYNKFKSILINNNYLNPKQKDEIYKGLISNININLYISPDYDYEIMNNIREALEDGLNLNEILEDFTTKQNLISKISKLRIKSKINLPDEILKKINENNLPVISKWLNKNFNLDLFLKNELYLYNPPQLELVMSCLNENLDISYFNKNLSVKQIEQIIYGLKNNLDVSQYAKLEYNDW